MVELSSVSQGSWVGIPFKPQFFSGFVCATAAAAYINVIIFHDFSKRTVVKLLKTIAIYMYRLKKMPTRLK